MTTPDPVDCFTALYQQTRPRVYAYAVSLAGRQLAEEIVSEVFLELQAGGIADDITERLAVLTALTVLSAADRELLTLVAWHGLAPAEAARVVGCSTAAYFVRLHRDPVTLFVLRSEHGRVSRLAVVPLGPRLALAASAVDSYNAVLSAGWTSATPRLPAPSRRFSVTTDGKG